MKFYANVENGILKVLKIEHLNEYLKNLKKANVSVEIKRVRKIRSINQNSLYWAWLEIISTDTGYDSEELHTTFKSMFLVDRTKKIPLVRSTTKLDKLQFGQYLDKIERVASELGIVLPNPEDYFAHIFDDLKTK